MKDVRPLPWKKQKRAGTEEQRKGKAPIKDFDYFKKFYEEKAEPLDFDEGCEVYYEEGQGFISYKMLNPETLYLSDSCCDNNIRWMSDAALRIAKEKGARFLITYTLRNPKAYLRLVHKIGHNAHLDLSLSRYLPNGKFYWFIIERID